MAGERDPEERKPAERLCKEPVNGAPITQMLRQMVIDSLVRPRAAARSVLASGAAAGDLVQAALAVTCVGMVLGFVAVQLSDGSVDAVSAIVLSNPLLGAILQFGVMLIVALLTFRIGRMFGGTGGLSGALALIVWLNFIMVLIQAGQLVALMVLPPLAAIVAIATLFWALWAYANFVTELHGFHNPVLVMGGVVLTVVVLFFGIALLLAILGLSPQRAV